MPSPTLAMLLLPDIFAWS